MPPVVELMPVVDFVVGVAMLVAIMLIHASGLRLVSAMFARYAGPLRRRRNLLLADLLFAGVIAGLLSLHLVEVAVWTLLVYYGDLIPNFRAAAFFCANTYTTVGYESVALPVGWEMLAPIMSISGLFTFGWTGSVLVNIVATVNEIRSPGQLRGEDSAGA